MSRKYMGQDSIRVGIVTQYICVGVTAVMLRGTEPGVRRCRGMISGLRMAGIAPTFKSTSL
jgi:hypothetical protein